jgi:hypothetical protein
MRESKEKIKARMIKNASRIWGFTDTEAESSFDPLVGMIMGALSHELDIISDDIHNTESRIVEKLIQLVTPEPITGPLPAHAILRADPVLPLFNISPTHQFYLYKKFKSLTDSSKTEEKIVFFTPSGSFKLIKGNIRFLASGNKIHEFRKEGYKEICAEAPRGAHLPLASFWLGIDLDEEVDSMDGLRIFFDLRSEHHASSFYQSLQRGDWYINDVQVNPSTGFGNEPERFRKDLDDVIKQEVDITAKVTSHVNNFYRDQFITIETGKLMLDSFISSEQYPKLIRETFNTNELEQSPRNLFWLEVRHGQPFPGEIIEELHCSINCFPVINRQINDFTISSRENINIIPLETEDSFLDIKSVSNTAGKTYTMKSFSSIGEIQKGTFLLRQGGINRFDSRNAREMINYLLELLRDESAAFSVLGSDMISSNLRELNQGIARLEQRLQDSHLSRENLSYLMLKADSQDDMVFVEFWSTKASGANKIKSGNKLSVYEGSDIKKDSVILMTSTIGGRDKMETEERLNAYRRTLLSRGRIVTSEDIKVLCYEHFGRMVDRVDIKRGVMKGEAVNTGFVRTVDIHINLSKRMTPYTEEELRFMIDDLQIKLREQSVNLLPYRVFVN